MKLFALLSLFILISCSKKEQRPKTPTIDAIIDSSIVTNHDSSMFTFNVIKEKSFTSEYLFQSYVPRGIGGGGAFSGLSISPYSSLWFVGTDMGTLFRSTNYGQNWYPVSHFQTRFSSDLKTSVAVGFSPNPKIVFHASGGINPVRSMDAGLTWKSIETINLDSDERILYWRSNSFEPNEIYAGTSKGLFKTTDNGKTFYRLSLPFEKSISTYIDYLKDTYYIYHVTANGIYKSIDEGRSFKNIYKPITFKIRKFTAGRDQSGVTFLFSDDQGGSACKNMFDPSVSEADWQKHIEHCGHLWISRDETNYKKTSIAIGDHLSMAENDSSSIYYTGSKSWIKQYGTKVYFSKDSGFSFKLIFNQLDWDVVPFMPWPKEKLEYSAVALDIGWWDSGYENFAIHLRNSKIIGGTGNFFVHTSFDQGNHWKAPFTRFSDVGEREENKKWSSTGLEVNSIYRFLFHPNLPKIGFAGSADIGGLSTDDGGRTFKILKVPYNSLYDFAFDLNQSHNIYSAAGDLHDFPSEWHGHVTEIQGGILRSENLGKTWIDLTKNHKDFKQQYLSVAYDSKNKILYGGTQGKGIVVSYDEGKSFQFLNEGLAQGPKIIPRIIIDPHSSDVYCLLAGDAPNFTNQNSTGIYLKKFNSDKWELLRGVIHKPFDLKTLSSEEDQSELEKKLKYWYYPVDFAIDFYSNTERNVMYLIDYENNQNWLMTGVWKSSDKGVNWHRQIQYTHPLSILINPDRPNEIFVNGFWSVDGKWGNGGAFSSKDFGLSFEKNYKLPYQSNGRSITIDPSNKNYLFYTFFGNSMLYGPKF